MKITTSFLVFLALSISASMASAQVVTKGTIVVIVTDPQGARLPGAVVRAEAADTVTSREATTNHSGVATFRSMDPSAYYVVTAQMSSFTPARNEAVLVRTGYTATVRLTLKLAGIAEEVTVTANSPLVDTASALTSQDITLDLTESLPTGRSYQSYLQLVPGVLPTDPSVATDGGGNPASKSGLNYQDGGGQNGLSRDNFYYVDGVNVTNGVSGTYGTNLNTEIIQEQQVLTGGIPAEYVGAPGLLSSVVTKSGSNTIHGSVNYFFQNSSLVAEDKNAPDQSYSRFDTAFTLGGPIVADKAWFFTSYRRLEREDDVAALDTLELMRTVENVQNQWYGKATWSPSSNDTVSFTFFSDPTDVSGTRWRDSTNARDSRFKTGGSNYRAAYSRMFGRDVLFDFAYAKHNQEGSVYPAVPGARNDVIYRSTDIRTLEDEQQGGLGYADIKHANTALLRAAVQWSSERHLIKGGFEFAQNTQDWDPTITPEGRWSSLAPHLSGLTARELAEGGFSGTGFDPFLASDYNNFIRSVNGNPRRDEFYGFFDTDRDGIISPDEVADNLVYDSSEGNPHGLINVDRNIQLQQGATEIKSEGLSFYIQDSFQLGNWVLNAGLRTERYEHFASTGESLYNFPWTFAPRLSVIYDLMGDGEQKLSAYYGKYYDPIRNNLTTFAGTLTGRVVQSQVFALGEWIPILTFGGVQNPAAIFAPTTQTPWTDDLQISYEVQLAPNMSFEALYTRRRTRDIVEDYDLSLYAFRDDGTTNYPGPVDHPDSLFLGLDYFGYDSFPTSNFVIATLAGAERNYQGLELIFRKRYSDNWQLLAAYTYNDANGNSNSDSSAGWPGDVLFEDPRAPNRFGDQPGSIRHLAKVSATYRFAMGLEVGGFYRWSSGNLANTASRAGGAYLPIRDAPSEFAGITRRWIAPDAVGSLTNPSWGLLDLRVQYYINQFGRVRGQIFMDVFNVADNQDSIRNLELVEGQGGIAFGEGILFNLPRRLFVGARLMF